MTSVGLLLDRESGKSNKRRTLKCFASPAESLTELAEDKAATCRLEEMQCCLPSSVRSTFLMAFSPDGLKVASTHADHNIWVCDVRTGKLLHTLRGHPRTPWCLAFHPTSNDILASGCLGGEVRVWDLHGGSEVWVADQKPVITSLAFHPSDKVLVIATLNQLHFWDWSLPAPFATCETGSEKEKVRFVKFDSQGTRLITGITNVPPENQRNHVWESVFGPTFSRTPPSRTFISQRRSILSRLMSMYRHLEGLEGNSRAPSASSAAPSGTISPTHDEALQRARMFAEEALGIRVNASELMDDEQPSGSSNEPMLRTREEEGEIAAEIPPVSSGTGGREETSAQGASEALNANADFWVTFHRLRFICSSLERRMQQQPPPSLLDLPVPPLPPPPILPEEETIPLIPPIPPPTASGSSDNMEMPDFNRATEGFSLDGREGPSAPDVSVSLVNLLTRLQHSLQSLSNAALTTAVAREQIQQVRTRIAEILERLANVSGYRARLTNLRDQIYEAADRMAQRGEDNTPTQRWDLAYCLWLVEMSLQLTRQMQRILAADYRLTQLHLTTAMPTSSNQSQSSSGANTVTVTAGTSSSTATTTVSSAQSSLSSLGCPPSTTASPSTTTATISSTTSIITTSTTTSTPSHPSSHTSTSLASIWARRNPVPRDTARTGLSTLAALAAQSTSLGGEEVSRNPPTNDAPRSFPSTSSARLSRMFYGGRIPNPLDRNQQQSTRTPQSWHSSDTSPFLWRCPPSINPDTPRTESTNRRGGNVPLRNRGRNPEAFANLLETASGLGSHRPRAYSGILDYAGVDLPPIPSSFASLFADHPLGARETPASVGASNRSSTTTLSRNNPETTDASTSTSVPLPSFNASGFQGRSTSRHSSSTSHPTSSQGRNAAVISSSRVITSAGRLPRSSVARRRWLNYRLSPFVARRRMYRWSSGPGPSSATGRYINSTENTPNYSNSSDESSEQHIQSAPRRTRRETGWSDSVPRNSTRGRRSGDFTNPNRNFVIPSVRIEPSTSPTNDSPPPLPADQRPRSPPLSAILSGAGVDLLVGSLGVLAGPNGASGSGGPSASNLGVIPRPGNPVSYFSLLYDSNFRRRARMGMGMESTHNITHRIQCWDFAHYVIPNIYDAESCMVVPKCKINNDASVDISRDGQLLAALVPNSGSLVQVVMLAIYSLLPKTMGQCLFTWSFENSNAISVSFSPAGRYVVVGMSSSRNSLGPPEREPVAQIFRLDPYTKNSTLTYVSSVYQEGGTQQIHSLNCVRWLPKSGQGLIYGTNRGLLLICRPISSSSKEGQRGSSLQLVSTATQTASLRPETHTTGTQTSGNVDTERGRL